MSETLTIKAYHNQKTQAQKRGIDFEMSFQEWKDWWIATGKAEMRGRKVGCYQMCRFQDVGPYALGNVYCATVTENLRHKQLGKPLAEETKLKVSETMTGRKLSEAHVLKITGKNNCRARKTITPLGVFDTASDAAKAHNVSNAIITRRVQNLNKPEYYYSTDNMEIQQHV